MLVCEFGVLQCGDRRCVCVFGGRSMRGRFPTHVSTPRATYASVLVGTI